MKYAPPRRGIGHALHRRKIQLSVQRAAEDDALRLIAGHLAPHQVAPRPGSLAREIYDVHVAVMAEHGFPRDTNARWLEA